jgi:hypothetical protein
MRSRTHDAPPGAGADFGIATGVVGIGEPVEARPSTLAEAVLAVMQAHGAKAGRMLHHFAGLPDGAFVWTRQCDGTYRVGRITGPWRYEDSRGARAVGIHHVRPVVWLPQRFGERDVPAAVAGTFARGGRNFQRIHDRDAERQTLEVWGRPTASRGRRTFPRKRLNP